MDSTTLQYADYCVPFGVGALLALILLRLTSLPIIRRKMYSIFMAAHFILLPAFVLFAALHTITPFYWSVPMLGIYCLDLLYRCFNYYANQKDAIGTIEAGGVVRIDVLNVGKICKPGQFFSIQVPKISRTFSHPFSISRIENGNISFMIKATSSNGWTTALLNSIHEKNQPLKLALDGPFCSPPFSKMEFDTLICIVAGSGAATAFPLLRKMSKKGKNCYFFWSVRGNDMLDLTFFREIIAEGLVCCSVHITNSTPKIAIVGSEDKESIENLLDDNHSDTSKESAAYKRTKGRMNPKDVLNSFSNASKVAVYTCGPHSFMNDVEAATVGHPEMLVFRETYEW
ncbi:hypothetical protein HDV06_002149 [Boothiomyces sp. JEL0866]|nr:hypothetical protein HDV06_002149 [Boothiomyces sp. JEL0866]